jgi:glycosyltransferase involved in cell wall biosynthesis
MKILIVCSKNSGRVAPFICDQVEALEKAGLVCDYFCIQGKGLKGYLGQRTALLRKIKSFQPDVIHAHYGLSGLLANTQRKIPVVTTYHGSDINVPKVFWLSKINMVLSAFNIFVSEKLAPKAAPKSPKAAHKSPKGDFEKETPLESPIKKGRNVLIPCGVDMELFVPMEKTVAREKMKLAAEKKYVLFSGAFNNHVKNPELAQSALALMPGVELLELKGYTRQEVAMLMNAVDVVLMTSHTEGSPQFIKEAMACNCPVVSVPVGDVPEVIGGVEGCYLASYEPADVAAKLKQVLAEGKRTAGRQVISERGLDAVSVAERIAEVYRRVYS